MNVKVQKKVIAQLEADFSKKYMVLKDKKVKSFFNDYQPDLELRNKKDNEKVEDFVDVVGNEELKRRRFMMLHNEWRNYGKYLVDKDLYIYIPFEWKDVDGSTVRGKDFIKHYFKDAWDYLLKDLKQVKAFTYDEKLKFNRIKLKQPLSEIPQITSIQQI